MTGSQALDHIAGPPRWAKRQQKTAEPSDIDQRGPEPPDLDPIDLGWTDDFDWAEPEYPDPCWPGWGARAWQRPMYLSNPTGSKWHRPPDRPVTPWNALYFGLIRQPNPEPEKSADWEAGQ